MLGAVLRAGTLGRWASPSQDTLRCAAVLSCPGPSSSDPLSPGVGRRPSTRPHPAPPRPAPSAWTPSRPRRPLHAPVVQVRLVAPRSSVNGSCFSSPPPFCERARTECLVAGSGKGPHGPAHKCRTWRRKPVSPGRQGEARRGPAGVGWAGATSRRGAAGSGRPAPRPPLRVVRVGAACASSQHGGRSQSPGSGRGGVA